MDWCKYDRDLRERVNLMQLSLTHLKRINDDCFKLLATNSTLLHVLYLVLSGSLVLRAIFKNLLFGFCLKAKRCARDKVGVDWSSQMVS